MSDPHSSEIPLSERLPHTFIGFDLTHVRLSLQEIQGGARDGQRLLSVSGMIGHDEKEYIRVCLTPETWQELYQAMQALLQEQEKNEKG